MFRFSPVILRRLPFVALRKVTRNAGVTGTPCQFSVVGTTWAYHFGYVVCAQALAVAGKATTVASFVCVYTASSDSPCLRICICSLLFRRCKKPLHRVHTVTRCLERDRALGTSVLFLSLSGEPTTPIGERLLLQRYWPCTPHHQRSPLHELIVNVAHFF